MPHIEGTETQGPPGPLGADLFQMALEAAPIGMMLVDSTGRIVLVNAKIEKLFGYARSDLVGLGVDTLVPRRFAADHRAFRDAFFGDPSTRAMGRGRDLFAVRRDGTEFPVEIGLNPLRTPEGTYVLASVADITERKRALDQFRLAIEASPTGMIMVDEQGRIVLVNAQIEALFGHSRETLVGQTIEMLVPERFRSRHPGFRSSFFSAPAARPMGAGRDLFGLRADGSEVPIEIGLNPLQTAAGSFVLSSVVDISERKRGEGERERLLVELQKLNRELEDRGRTLAGTLRERETMLREIHHRVKNNLQIISSLINMQVRKLEGVTGRVALEDCQSRVQAMALIHEQLYESQDYTRVSLAPYVSHLAQNVLLATEASSGRVSLQLEVSGVALSVDQAIPCGLIVNELITNAVKHAFPGDRGGTLRVGLELVDGVRVHLSVSDDGVGLPPGFDLRRTGSLGLQLVYALAEQVGGTVHVVTPPGTTFDITFPLEA